VRVGEVLFEDRRFPELVVTSPAAGTVTRIERGERRALRCIEVQCEGAESVEFESYSRDALDGLLRAAVVQRLLESGLWASLRERPFGRIPRPDATPHALFVTAMETRPLGPSVDLVLDGAEDAFRAGCAVLRHLPSGLLFICTAPHTELDVDDVPEAEVVHFEGPHPAGLAGTHMHFLAPVQLSRPAWHIGYQDTIAIGRLFLSGHLSVERVVALGGPGLTRPRQVRTRLGASVMDLVGGDVREGPQRILSGSVLHGRRIEKGEAFLGRHDEQITVLPDDASRQPGATTALHGRRVNMLPLRIYEHLCPLDLLVVPLLRALLAGDVERAQALGCMELDEEDLSLLTYACPSKQDYGPHLRSVLQRIEEEA
jgi:Na+-transporting NADH:ubiquinone oxidoreductase subunit A